MKLEEYIRGARHGREAHELELESMRDALLGDALDGFDAVPGDHSASLERLSDAIRKSAASGRAAARARASRHGERRVRGWSIAAAAVFLAGVAGGGVWLLRDGVPVTGTGPEIARKTASGGRTYHEEVAILPPVTVIKEDAPPVAEATDFSTAQFDSNEIGDLSDAIAAEEALPSPAIAETRIAAERALPSPAIAETGIAEPPVIAAEAISSSATAETRIAARAVTAAAPAAPARDTAQTAAFREFVAGRNRVRSAVMGPVTISFKVGADGRPRNVDIVESPTPELAGFARALLDEGPDWPPEPSRKLITINL